MPKPLIGISTYHEESARWGAWQQPAALVPLNYPEYFRRAGALTVLLPPDEPDAAVETVERLDAVVIAGGPDVRPQRYGAQPHPRSGPHNDARDLWEIALIEAALASNTPLLAICRGMQLLNVVLGGTLIQHLPDVVGHGEHSGSPGAMAAHVVEPIPGTLFGSLGVEAYEVPTFHHQAVDRLGNGLVVCARARDGIVEAVEAPNEKFVLGVQWHPEAGRDTRVADALVAAARRPHLVPAQRPETLHAAAVADTSSPVA
ncbi:gamma-glutamyl-gamma-aminobutyrate hydrolase [Embleya scabrispora]|uniref:Gamma-glutamyl-gamma-aminobutyrate hydrolase n=1 Tax=Embleya scabrispora TaxID=159449 RepID=A0A1T3NNJ5_9ACTN|nr:gamma-glutamyl-gamma-aminobutyrate hydrolase family protein [Embleya scabrispora]OPC78312.1 gamma-glutamyl-gamma-aminobutyrate hydrolase [Embleya scabrispora]